MKAFALNRKNHNVTAYIPLSIYGSPAILHPIFFDLIINVFRANFLALLFGGMLFSVLCYHCLFLSFLISKIRFDQEAMGQTGS